MTDLDAAPPQLSTLVRPALLRVFQLLDWHDALNLALTCKSLLQVGRPALCRTRACLACFAPLCDAGSQHKSSSRGYSFDLDDGRALCLGSPSDLFVAPEQGEGADADEKPRFGSVEPGASFLIEMELMFHLDPRARHRRGAVKGRNLFCRCGLFLGIHFVQIGGQKAGKIDHDMTNWRYAMFLDRVFVARPYVTLLRPFDGLEDGYLGRTPTTSHVFVCKGLLRVDGGARLCEAVIFERRAILSSDHRWKLRRPSEEQQAAAAEEEGGGSDDAEEAFYINHVETPLHAYPARTERLAQGRMRVADVGCKRCGAMLGWRFIKCLENGLNAHFCGRWGIVGSAVRKKEAVHRREHFERCIDFLSLKAKQQHLDV